MAYGHKVLGNAVRKAGGTLQSLDDAYSEKIAALYQDANPVMQSAAYLIGGAHPSFRKAEPQIKEGAGRGERAMGAIAEYAIPAANAVPKYALPAGGITAAGLGLIELAQQISPSGDQQTESTLMPN